MGFRTKLRAYSIASKEYLLSFKRDTVKYFMSKIPESYKLKSYQRHYAEPDSRRLMESFFSGGDLPLFDTVHIESITMCNSTCSFCAAAVQYKFRKPSEVMPDEMVEKILNDLSALNYGGRITLYCNNEPLLEKRQEKFLRMARARCPNAQLEMKTNGKLLTVERLKALFDAGLEICNINDYRPDRHLSKKVMKFIEDYDGEFTLKGREINIYLRKEKEVLLNRAGTNPTGRKLPGAYPIPCFRPFTMMTINYEGKVAACSNDLFFSHVLGNVRDQSIKQIWEGPAFQKMRESMMKGDRTPFSTCAQCDFAGYSSELNIY